MSVTDDDDVIDDDKRLVEGGGVAASLVVVAFVFVFVVGRCGPLYFLNFIQVQNHKLIINKL